MRTFLIAALLITAGTLLAQYNQKAVHYVSGYDNGNRLPTAAEVKAKLQESENRILQGSPQLKGGGGSTNHLFTTGPEQDCDGAIAVCQQTYVEPNSYTGYGNVQEVYNTCLSNGEQFSVWYVFTVQNSGDFSFTIQTQNDYDFALYDITTIGCAGVPNASPVRCNFSATYGNTGLSLPASPTIPLSYGAGGAPMMPGLDVTAGATYVLIIDNWTQDNNGYTITFGGSASIFDVTPPGFLSAVQNCATFDQINVAFDEPIQCNSIQSNGADFTLTGPAGAVTIIAAAGAGCTGTLTSQATLTFDNSTQVPSGTYTLTHVGGLLDKCGNPMNNGETISFDYLAPITISASAAQVCQGNSATLNAIGGPNSGATYIWNPGGSTDSFLVVTPTVSTSYSVTVSYGSCTGSATQVISIDAAPVVSVTPMNLTLCSGTTPITASATINGNPCTDCNFYWTGSVTQTDLNTFSSVIASADTGSYTVNVASSIGCPGNMATTVISGPLSPPVPSCNVIYVEPSGVGTGFVRNSPTNLLNALSMAQCNSIVIKMTTGTYVISDPITTLTSFVTLEGGYDASFTTKTSEAGATTIIRDTNNVQGQPTSPRLVAFEIIGQTNFRLQDLTIETSNAQAATLTNSKGISTYGVYLNNCSDYNIVRCQILSGDASAGLTGATGVSGSSGGAGGDGGNGGLCWNLFGCTVGGAGGGTGGTSGVGNSGGNGGIGGYGEVSFSGGFGSGVNGIPGLGSAPGSGGNGGTGFNEVIGGSCDNPGLPFDGTAGTTGGDGAASSNGIAGSYSIAGGFFIPGNGTSGTDGSDGSGGGGGGGSGGQGSTVGNADGGSGGGGGGGGGQAGTGGDDGGGHGASFGAYLYSNGGNGSFANCFIQAGSYVTINNGGSGGIGGNGGSGGTGGDNCESGKGGDGGNGGKGSDGGNGGYGSPGLNYNLFYDPSVSFSNLVVADSAFGLAAQDTIVVDNISCTNIDIDHNTSAGSPIWIFGFGANPPNGSGATVPVQYNTTSHKTIDMNGDIYMDFLNILVTDSMAGNIIASSNLICPDTAFFSYSGAGPTGLVYSWSVSPSADSILSADSSYTQIDFSSTATTTTYVVTLDINSECCGQLPSFTDSITVIPPEDPMVMNDTICDGGTATLYATNGPGFTYNWYDQASGGTLLATDSGYTVTGATSTTTFYVETVNALGCVGNRIPVTLVVAPLTAPTAPNVVACDTGLVYVIVDPVSGATAYNWYDQASGGTLLQSNNGFSYGVYISTTGTSVDVYVSYTIPGCGESPRTMVTATVDNNIIATNPTLDTICGGAQVMLNAGASGGTGTFTYLWSPITTADSVLANPTVSPTTSTSYSVEITSGPCSVTINVPVIISGQLDASVTISNISCNGDADGSITLSPIGGTPPVTYQWDVQAGGGTDSSAMGLSGGTYLVTITDASGCGKIDSATVNEPAALSTVPVTNDVICNGLSNGIATIVVSGGTAPYTIDWGTADTSSLAAGTYVYTVTDSNSCSLTDSLTITEPDSIGLNTTASDANCGSQDGDATVTATGGIPPYVYLWDDVAGQTTETATGLGGGNYLVLVTDSMGCQNSSSVTVADLPLAATVSGDSSLCQGETAQLTAGGGTVYSWSTGETTATISVSPIASTSYTVIVSTPACPVDTIVITVIVNLPPVVQVIPDSITIAEGTSAQLNASGASTYAWTPTEGLSCSSCPDPEASPSVTTTYWVTGTDAQGCSAAAALTVIINANDNIVYLPNTFSPFNDNGDNQTLQVFGSNIAEINLVIFDRWGEKVYESTDASEAMRADGKCCAYGTGWDGTWKNGGSKVNVASFAYLLRGKFRDGEEFEKHGNITLIK